MCVITMCTNEKLAAVRVKIVVNLLHACYTAYNNIIFVVVIIVANTYLTATLAAAVVNITR